MTVRPHASAATPTEANDSRDADTDWLRIDAIDVAYPASGIRAAPRRVVQGCSLHLRAGEIGCLLGASGCGKTTVLRAIAGFEPLRAGRIALQGREIASAAGGLPPERRRIGMMFQDYALFPHLSAADNLAFGLRALAKPARAARVAEMLALVGLQDRAHAFPHELSGGQQQRIALARALAPAPALLLLDEPFSNLDSETRTRLLEDTRRVLKAAGATALMVTHDQHEAFAIADRIGVMAEGRILQWDTPQALYAAPVDSRVAGFIGRGDWLQASSLGLPGEGRVRLRPGQLRLDADGPLTAVLESAAFRGPGYAGRLRFASGDRAEIELDADSTSRLGQALRLRLTDSELLRFPDEARPG